MERNCKNCRSLVYAGKTYCSDCGAKWIEKRITLRNVGEDFADMYVGVDTKFVRTFIDLFRKPENVIMGYITGRRMNYVDAVRYLLLSLFVTGAFMFIMKFMDINMMEIMDLESLYKEMGYSQERINAELKMQQKIQEVQSKYLSIIIFASMPIMALIGKITFWGKKYFNFTEHVVFYMYTYSHIVIATNFISIPLLLLSPSSFIYWSFMSYVIMPLYITYCYKRCFQLSWQEAILKMLIALMVMVVTTIVITIVVVILGFLIALIYKKIIDPSWDLGTLFPAAIK